MESIQSLQPQLHELQKQLQQQVDVDIIKDEQQYEQLYCSIIGIINNHCQFLREIQILQRRALSRLDTYIEQQIQEPSDEEQMKQSDNEDEILQITKNKNQQSSRGRSKIINKPLEVINYDDQEQQIDDISIMQSTKSIKSKKNKLQLSDEPQEQIKQKSTQRKTKKQVVDEQEIPKQKKQSKVLKDDQEIKKKNKKSTKNQIDNHIDNHIDNQE